MSVWVEKYVVRKKQSTVIYLSNIFLYCDCKQGFFLLHSAVSVSIPLGKSLDKDICTHQGYDETLHYYNKLTMFSLK